MQKAVCRAAISIEIEYFQIKYKIHIFIVKFILCSQLGGGG